MAPVVLWVDELEKGFAGARASTTGGTQEGGAAGHVLGSFLTWLQEKTKPVFVVAPPTTSPRCRRSSSAKAASTRSSSSISPTVHERESIFAIHLQKRMRDPRRFDVKSSRARRALLGRGDRAKWSWPALYRAFGERASSRRRRQPLDRRDGAALLQPTKSA